MKEETKDGSIPSVKFLTVVWGESYIQRFCKLSLPSFLASGNLPTLAASTRLEVVIMTSRKDIGVFEINASFRKLKSFCKVRFVDIDDLITNNVYGVILTLAYARPIIECGKNMLNTHFVFMNADFVLANGSLRSLTKHIYAGRSIVLGPSYRAIAEELEPKLEEMMDPRSEIIEIEPRQLVDLALRHPHRTTIAKMFNQKGFHSSHPNQLFWQVDENTVLGRYYLIFMLCLKPERIMESVNGFCDYSFIPDLCPSGDEVAMGDSDEFFMLELQSRKQETFMLKQGEMTTSTIAKSLQEWSTHAHRRSAGYDIVFHSKDVPPQIEDVKAIAENTVLNIQQRLGKPKKHRNHHYWVMGVGAWKEYRRLQGQSCNPPELAHCKPGMKTLFSLIKYFLLIRFKNFYTNSRFSPYWAISQEHRRFFDTLRNKNENKSLLIVRDASRVEWLTDIAKQYVEVCESDWMELVDRPSTIRYDYVFFVAVTMDDSNLTEKLSHSLTFLNPGGSFWLTVIQPQHEHIVYSQIIEIGELLQNRIRSVCIYSKTNILLYFSHRMLQISFRILRSRYRLIVAIFSAPVIFMSMVFAFIGNLFKHSSVYSRFVKSNIGLIIKIGLHGVIEGENRPPPKKELN